MSLPLPPEPKETVWHPNRAYITLPNGIIVDSCFPGGNVASATLLSLSPVSIQLEGNTDISLDNTSKYWLHFRMRGFRKDKPVKLILKNANHLRKYYGQTRFRPYMVYRQEEDQVWQSCPVPIELTILQNGHFQGAFLFQSEKNIKASKTIKSTSELYPQKQQKIIASTTTAKSENNRGSCYFAIYYPYSYDDLMTFIQKVKKQEQEHSNKSDRAYFHEQIIAYSYERRKIPLITITSHKNIESFSQKEPIISEEIFPHPKQRPFKLKNNPVLLFTARVHPSQTASSFFAQGLVDFLLSDNKTSAILREMFIIQIIPMLNPDGVQHGNFRFDHELRNLNRYYGQSSIDKTPSIRAAELLVDYYKNRNNQQSKFTEFYQETYSRLFMYVDVHGHSSALPSFIYGNHTDKIEHFIENKMFCKLIELNFVAGGFSKVECQFSKRNMTLQQKYDQFSKLCSGRVFAGRAYIPQQSVFHSYTLEVLPYWEQFQRKKSDQKIQKLSSPDYARLLGKQFLVSILDLLDLNPQSKLLDCQMDRLRRTISKQCYNEQVRKQFLFRRIESSIEKSTHTEMGKLRQNLNERDFSFHNEYIQRWFNNQIFLKHFLSKSQLLKQPKLLKFCQKVSKMMQIQIDSELLPCSQRKDISKQEGNQRTKRSQSPFKCESPSKYESPSKLQSSSNIQQITTPLQIAIIDSTRNITPKQLKKMGSIEQRQIFMCRSKQRTRVQTKISKHTIELKQSFIQLKPRLRTIERQVDCRLGRRQLAIKKQPFMRQTCDSTDRYEKEVLNKIHTETKGVNFKAAVMDIKKKQIKLKIKSNGRMQTQIISCQPISTTSGTDNTTKINNSNTQIGTFHPREKHTFSKDGSYVNNNANTYCRPSFIEQFILKIREQRQNANHNHNNKYSNRQQLKQKAMKLRPSIKQHIEQQQKKLLPVLRRNKVFTIVSDYPHQPASTEVSAYDSIGYNKKRATTVQSESNLEQIVKKNKHFLVAGKRQEIVKQQLLKKSQQFSQYKYF